MTPPLAHGDRLALAGTLNRRAAIASVCVALILSALKSYAVWRTGSIAMLGSLADTGLDLVASLVTLVAVRVAAHPADHHHRFGHGKAEALAALFQVSLISVAALGIIVRSAQRVSDGSEPTAIEYGVGVSLVAMVLTVVLVAYQARIVRLTGSVAINADNLHYRSDLALNASVIAALLLESLLHLHGADALFGLAIGVWLMLSAWRTATHAIGQLMDKEWPLEKRERFLAAAAGHPGRDPGFRGIHDLRTRSSGAHDFAQFHIWVDPAMTVAQAHTVMEALEARLHAAFPGVELLIHTDPVGQVDSDDPIAERNVLADLKTAQEPRP
ncbi:MAG: divalent metal cation transporter FieF [Sphingobium sp. 66-54]|nr:MAG: divalent metal cation transporter FieF [Sphingobium sp. 66-54]